MRVHLRRAAAALGAGAAIVMGTAAAASAAPARTPAYTSAPSYTVTYNTSHTSTTITVSNAGGGTSICIYGAGLPAAGACSHGNSIETAAVIPGKTYQAVIIYAPKNYIAFATFTVPAAVVVAPTYAVTYNTTHTSATITVSNAGPGTSIGVYGAGLPAAGVYSNGSTTLTFPVVPTKTYQALVFYTPKSYSAFFSFTVPAVVSSTAPSYAVTFNAAHTSATVTVTNAGGGTSIGAYGAGLPASGVYSNGSTHLTFTVIPTKTYQVLISYPPKSYTASFSFKA